MLKSKTRIGSDTFSMPVAPGFEVSQEGVPLVAYHVAGQSFAIPSRGLAGEVFLGFSTSVSNKLDRAVLNKVFRVPSTAPFTVNTGVALIGANLNVRIGGAAALVEVAIAPAAGEVQVITGSPLLTFNAAQAGVEFVLHASYVPTVAQALEAQGTGPAGGLAAVAESVIGVIRSGSVYTDRYDVNADFSSGTDNPPVLRTGAGGVVTVGGAGTVIAGVVLQTPAVNDAFVGVRLG